MSKKAICLVIFSLMLILPIVSASATINIKTYPTHKIFLSILEEGDEYKLLESYSAMSDSEGKATFTYTGTKAEIRMIVKITEEGEKIALEDFDDDPFSTSSPIYVMVTPDESIADYESEWNPVVIEENTSASIENLTVPAEETADSEESSGGFLTGFVSSAKDIATSKTTYYILGSIALIVVLGFVFVSKVLPAVKRRKSSVSSSSAESSEKAAYNPQSEKIIEEAERKIRAAQTEINALKNKEKISAAERKLQMDREELEKLKRGY